MKTSALLATALLALATFAHAAPTEINYQGVLTDQNGNPVNGVRAMQIKIYDAPTGGALLYSEDLGNVTVQDGIYSFSFGGNGTSNALTTETVAIANGTVSTFQKVLAAPTVVAGSVTVTDGTYTWDQTNGSSNENDFSVAYSPNLRRVTVTYYNGNPAAGKTISATYRTPAAGVSGAISASNQPWIETTINGTPQSPRQKVLSVPFAAVAAAVEDGVMSSSKTVDLKFKPSPWPVTTAGLAGTNHGAQKSYIYNSAVYIKRIRSITLTYSCVSAAQWGATGTGGVAVSIKDSQGSILKNYNFPDAVNNRTVVLDVNVDVEFGDLVQIEFLSYTGVVNPNGNHPYAAGYSTIHSASFVADVQKAAAW
jgi:hypothetical protein